MSDALVIYTDVEWVSARDLHARLGLGYDFTTWFKDQIDRFQLTEGQDFRVFPVNRVNPHGGRPSIDYQIHLDIAKMIAVSTRGPKSMEARRYLIELEKKWNSPQVVMARALQMASNTLVQYEREKQQLTEENQKLLPKAEWYDEYMAADGAMSLAEAANLIYTRLGINIGQNRLCAFLKFWNILTFDNRPTQAQVEAKRFVIHLVTRNGKRFAHACLTPKGLDFVIRGIKKRYDEFIPVWNRYHNAENVEWVTLRRRLQSE